MKFTKILFITLFSLAIFSIGNTAFAANIYVDDSTGDLQNNSLCSISEAIISSNEDSNINAQDCISGSGTDTIIFNTDVVLTTPYMNGYYPTSANPWITDSVIFDGKDHTISRTGTDEMNFFEVFGDDYVNSIEFRNINIDGGTGFQGGAIRLSGFGELKVKDSTFTNNTSGDGGAIYTVGGNKVTIEKTNFIGNNAYAFGSVLSITSDLFGNNYTNLNILNSNFEDNHSTSGWMQEKWGGAVALYAVNTFINNSVFDNNIGGAIYTWGGQGETVRTKLSVRNSTFSGSHTEIKASAFHFDGTTTAIILNSTVSGNVSDDTSVISLFDNLSRLSIAYSTFANNDSGNNHGVTRTIFVPEQVVIENSIFSGNTGGDECNFATLQNVSLVNNLSDDLTCGQSSVTSLDSSLGNNGGYTKTHKLSKTSNAVDTALTNPGQVIFKCPKMDQRGVSRMIDGNSDGIQKCDIGAYEYNGKAAEKLTKFTSKR